MEGDILDSLEQLGYDGPLLEEKCLLSGVEGGLSSPEFVDLCVWLASRLKTLCNLEESISSGPGDIDGLQLEMSSLLKELHCPYKAVLAGILKGQLQIKKHNLQLLLFLSSELQAAQMERSKMGSKKEGRDGNFHQDLQDICQTLVLPEPRGRDIEEVFSQVEEQINKVLQKLPTGIMEEPVLTKTLSHDQWEKLNSINVALTSEYECRRRMLIKRLDVTVQSFGWSDRAKVKVDSMARAYQPRRHSLRPQPSVGVAELLAAREDICNVVKTSSGSSREHTACAVNKVLLSLVLQSLPGRWDKDTIDSRYFCRVIL
uniref:Family with sequence similarity 98 member B n=1 Tax=Gadus morhua TaxID=8049 RepID=A0A8C4Z8W3_GADMO